MEAVWIGLGFIVWYALALMVAERFNAKSKLGKQWLFFISFMFSPLTGYLVGFYTKRKH
jgi:hypothetical protein